MLAKLVHAAVDPQRIADAAHAVQTELAPAFLAHGGAQQGYWMADRATGRVLIMTVWSDSGSLRAEQIADGTERTVIAERVGFRVDAVQTMEVLAAHDPTIVGSPVLRSARATWVEGLDPARLDGLAAVHHDVVPDQRRSEGFCGSYWLADSDAGNGLALSFWQGAAALGLGERASRRRRRRLGRELGFRTAGVTEYEALGVVAVAVPEELPAVSTGFQPHVLTDR